MSDSSSDSEGFDWVGAPAVAANPAARLEMLRMLVQQMRTIEEASDEASVSASSDGSGNEVDSAALVAAIQAGDVAEVRRLLDDNVNWVLQLNSHNYSTMALAAHFGQIEVLRAIFQMGGNVEPDDDADITPMYAAACAGHVDVVRLLVTEMGADANSENDIPPIVLACSRGHLPLLRYLMEELHIELPRGVDGLDPLHAAAGANHMEVVRYLLTKHGLDVNLRSTNLKTLLHCAAQGGQMDMVEMLVGEWRADVNVVDDRDATPLTCAIQCGHLDVVQYLMANGASTSLGDPLRAACMAGRVDILRWLLDLGLRPSNVHDLVMAAAGRRSGGGGNVLRELVARFECSLNMPGDNGYAPLFHAVHNGADTVPVLIELGANDRAGAHPLESPTSALLQERIVTADMTLLSHAVYCCEGNIARYLVEVRGHEVPTDVFRTACRSTEAFAAWLVDSGRADWRVVPGCRLARRLQEQHRRMRIEGLGSPLPAHLRRAVVALLLVGRAHMPPMVLRRVADALVRNVGRDVHDHPLGRSADTERVCRGCARRVLCRTCAICSFGLCADCATGLE